MAELGCRRAQRSSTFVVPPARSDRMSATSRRGVRGRPWAWSTIASRLNATTLQSARSAAASATEAPATAASAMPNLRIEPLLSMSRQAAGRADCQSVTTKS